MNNCKKVNEKVKKQRWRRKFQKEYKTLELWVETFTCILSAEIFYHLFISDLKSKIEITLVNAISPKTIFRNGVKS